MRTRIIPLTVASTVTASLALAFVPVQAAPPPTTVQMSVTTGGFAPDHGSNGDTTAAARQLSKDGRYVVFASSGPVVPGQKQLNWQIVRRDRQLGTTELISKSSTGAMGNGHSYHPSVSADGQVIAFHSSSSNLVPGDTNNDSDIFVHDVRTRKTIRASVTSNGGQVDAHGNANPVGPPSISANGRFVGFTATVSGLTPDDSNSANAYLYDRQNGTIEVVSRNDSGNVISGHVVTPVTVSADGNLVTFQSLVNNHAIQVLVRNRSQGTTTIVGGEEWRDLRQSMTPDGRYVVYDTSDANQVPNDTNGKADVFVHDRVTGTYELVSVSGNGVQGNGNSSYGSISDDGRYVAFRSNATNLIPGDTNNEADVFRHDRQTGQTIRVSVGTNGAQATGSADSPSISGDGQHIVFNSYSRLTPSATRSWQQVFVRDLIGKYPALNARIGALPGKVQPNKTQRVVTYDIRTGPALEIVWTPAGNTKGKAIRQNAAVSGNAFVLRSPGLKRAGKYVVTVKYASHTLRSRTINVLKPKAKKLPKAIKKGKKLKVKTVGVDRGQKVQVRFKPRGKTGGKQVRRVGKTNKKGVVKVKTPPRRGAYQVVIRHKKQVLRKGVVRFR